MPIFAVKDKLNNKTMTATTKKVMETPMGPYIGVMQSLSRKDMQIIVSFFQEQLQQTSGSKSNADIIREKYKDLKVPPAVKNLRGCIKLKQEELNDERTQYILNL